ncbi:MAG: ATP-dependent DNA helicase RecG [Fimbriimonas sp.]|nr:ATP-dependent DNA helicase RecG [Fimbriimonas sp.]
MFEQSLESEVQFLKGVGPRNANSLRKVGLNTVGDVLYYMPRRYEDRRNIPPIALIQPGQYVTVRGQIMSVEARPTRAGMVILKAVLRDRSGVIALTWFNQPWLKRILENVQGEVIAYGLVKESNWNYEIAAPEWETLTEEDDPDDFARIVPVYPLTEGLAQKTIRKAARHAIQDYVHLVTDPLPSDILQGQGMRDLKWSLTQIHVPSSEEERLEARRRLVFEEFFYMQTALAMRRAETQQELGISFAISDLLKGIDPEASVPARQVGRESKRAKSKAALERAMATFGDGVETSLNGATAKPVYVEAEFQPAHLFVEEQRSHYQGQPLWDQIHKMLPFELTGAQKRVIAEIWDDMERPHPMNRLVQGDVGSGKTAVAACCMLPAVRCGYQAALMAPTEILAEQHFVNLQRLFEPLGVDVELLVGKQTAAQKKKSAERTKSGQVHIAVGTHALIQEGIEFANLGLVVIDEQHKFGVLQRKALRDKSLGNPDVLVMTATPIPRTLTMAAFGDLELSVIDELPPGRRPVKTHAKQPYDRQSVYEGVLKLVEQGRQAYFVCPMVSESEKMMAQAATELHVRLSTGVFQGRSVGLLHGQMKPSEKEAVMERFRRHDVDVLVATTVVEVGVDVPNSSVMVIEDANRFGLSQLHQLRGRVGRGAQQSYCILIGDTKGDEARARIEAMVGTNDGFEIAEIDLRLRGPGSMLGTQQSGNLDYKIADLVQDGRMLEVARKAAFRLIEIDPRLEKPEHCGILAMVQQKRSDAAVVTVS